MQSAADLQAAGCGTCMLVACTSVWQLPISLVLQGSFAMQPAPCWIGAAQQLPTETLVSCRMQKGPAHSHFSLYFRMP